MKPLQTRRSPGDQLVVVVGVAVAAIVVAVAALGLLSSFSLSPATQEIGTLAISIAVVIAIAVVVTRVIQGPPPTVPSNIPEQRAKRRGVLKAAGVCVAVWAAVSALGFAGIENYPGAFISAFTLLLGIPITLGFYAVARRADRNATLVAVDPWIRWEYDPEEWRRVAELRQGMAKRSLGKETPQVIAGPRGLIFGDRFLAWDEPGTRLVRAWAESQPAPVVIFGFLLVLKTTLKVEYVAPRPANSEADLQVLQAHLQSLSHRPEVHLA